MNLEAFFTLHSDLPREGPGSDASTLKAINRLPGLPESPHVLDLGCGPGRQTLVLARTLKAPVVAIDVHQPFLDQLTNAAAKAGLADYVKTRRISMDALDYPPESIDLIWSEGAVYIIGVSKALRLWRPMLRTGGLLAFTEATWLIDNPPAEAAAFWEKEYPDINTVAGNSRKAEAEDYEVIDTFTLPAEDWWAEYYAPLQERITALRSGSADWPELAAVIDETEQEINMFARFGDSHGYVFYVLGKPAHSTLER